MYPVQSEAATSAPRSPFLLERHLDVWKGLLIIGCGGEKFINILQILLALLFINWLLSQERSQRFLSVDFKGMYIFSDQGVIEKIILKRIMQKYDVTRFIDSA